MVARGRVSALLSVLMLLTASSLASADSVTQNVSQSTVSGGDTPQAQQLMDPTGVTNPIYQTIVALSGEHNYVPNSAKAPANSTIQYSTDGTTYNSTQSAATKFVKFGGPLAAGAGAVAPVGAAFNSVIAGSPNEGDGFAPIVTDTRVYNLNHHTQPARLECHELSNGAVCAGYPFLFPTGVANLSTGFAVHGHIDAQSGHLWFPAQVFTDPLNTGHGDAGTATGFACIDVGKTTPTNPPTSCGWVPTGTGAFETWPVYTGHADWGGSLQSGAAYGRKLYAIDTTGAIQCVDMATSAACSGQPYSTGLQTSDPFGIQLTQIGNTSKFVARTNPPTGLTNITTFAGNGPSQVICFDATNNAVCSGWGGGPQTLGDANKTVNGGIISAQAPGGGSWDRFCGIVAVNQWLGNSASTLDVQCRMLDGSGSVAAPTGMSTMPGGASGYQLGWAGTGEVTTYGSRVYFTLNHYVNVLFLRVPDTNDRLECYDYAAGGTGGICSGFPHDFFGGVSGGPLDQQVSATYATAVDPTGTCIWTLGDPGQLVQHDAADPSTSCSFATVNQHVDRADSYCGTTPGDVATAAWGQVKIRNVASPADYSGAYLTVYDKNGDAVGGWDHVSISGSSIDISSIPATGNTSEITVVVRFGGAQSTPFASGNTFIEVTWDSTEAPRTCVGSVVAASSCPTIATGATFTATAQYATSGASFGPQRQDQDVLARSAAEQLACQPVTTQTTTTQTTTTTETTTPTTTTQQTTTTKTETTPTPVTPTVKPVISLTKKASKTRLRAGQTVVYTLTVKVSKATATDVELCDDLPSGLSYVKVPGAKMRGGKACWSFGDMKAGASKTVKVTAKAQRVSAPKRITNTAVVDGSNVSRKTADAVVRIDASGVASRSQGGVTG